MCRDLFVLEWNKNKKKVTIEGLKSKNFVDQSIPNLLFRCQVFVVLESRQQSSFQDFSCFCVQSCTGLSVVFRKWNPHSQVMCGHFCFPFFFLAAHWALALPAAVQMDFGDRDGLDALFLALLIDDEDVLLIFDGVAVERRHGGVAAWPSPDLHGLVFPRRPVSKRPAQSHVHP